jgi:dephospho-CoA kinase
VKPPRLLVGLTGGIGSGKSTALKAFSRRGTNTLSLDQIVREQARPGNDAWKAIKKAFPRFVDENGVLDRARLGSHVFAHRAARRRLERITHPLVLAEMRRLISRMRGVVVVDVPLLFEAGLSHLFDVSVVVSSKHQFKRVKTRDRLPAAEIHRRIKAQFPLSKKEALADIVLENDGSKADLDKKVARLDAGLQLLYGGTR